MVMPCVVYSTLSDTDTLTLNASTTMITVESSVAGTIDFEATDGTAPTGALMPVRLVENIARDFDVRAGTVIRFDAA